MKRWFQFSLRGLLVCLTAFAVWLGWTVERARRQKEAVNAIVGTGGNVIYAWQCDADGARDPEAECPIPEGVRRLIGDDFFFSLAGISFGRSTRDSDLACPSKIDGKAVRFVWLGDTWVTDSGVLALPPMPKLDSLNLKGTRITDAALASLVRYPELMYLVLDENPLITDDGVRNLRHLSHLRTLSLHRTRGLFRGHVELREYLPDCAVLRSE